MAVPTFSSVSPVSGHTAGRAVVEVLGSNFQVPVVPDTGAARAPAPATVRVLFGDVPAELVDVVSSTRLFVTTPIHDSGAVTLTVQNLDTAGAIISGEQTVSPDGAYTFLRPTLTSEAANQSDIQRLVRTFVLELRRQIFDSVMISESTDYDPDTGVEISVINVPSFPHLVLVGPMLKENRFYSKNDPPDFQDDDGNFVEMKVPKTFDLEFSIVGVSNSSIELLNLLQVTANFFRDNTEIRMDRSATDSSRGRNEYELDLTADGGLSSTGKANNSNVHSFSGRCVIRGFDIESASGIDSQEIAGTGVPAAGVNARGFIADQKGAVLDPVEQLGVASSLVVSSIMSQGGQPQIPKSKSSAPLVVRAILSPGD